MPRLSMRLVRAVRDDSPTVRMLAINALAASGTDPANLTPTLVNALKDMSAPVQMAALEALVKLKQEPKVVVPLLLTAAGDGPRTIPVTGWHRRQGALERTRRVGQGLSSTRSILAAFAER